MDQVNRKTVYSREFRRKNPNYHFEWRQRNLETSRNSVRRYKGGKPESTTRLQPIRCECCDKETEKLHWDHDHVTGLFRGWLCAHCNILLGNLEKHPERVICLIKWANLEERYKELWTK